MNAVEITAQEALVQDIAQIEVLLDTLKNKVVDDHCGALPESTHWGHVGTTEYIAFRLQELVDLL